MEIGLRCAVFVRLYFNLWEVGHRPYKITTGFLLCVDGWISLATCSLCCCSPPPARPAPNESSAQTAHTQCLL